MFHLLHLKNIIIIIIYHVSNTIIVTIYNLISKLNKLFKWQLSISIFLAIEKTSIIMYK